MTEHHRLSDVPTDPNERSLWMQHGVGYLLMREVRDAMRAEIVREVAPESQELAFAVVDNTIYKTCMLVEGVGPPLRNGDLNLEVDLTARLCDNSTNGVVTTQSMKDGDGICVGFHGWIEGDFGEGRVRPVVD